MAFDSTTLSVGADSQRLLVSSAGAVLVPVTTSDSDPGLTTPGPSAGRCVVYYVSSDGDVGIMVAPAPKQEAAYNSSGGVTCNALASAPVSLQRCEKFSGAGTITSTSAAAIKRVAIRSGSGTVTTASAATLVLRRVEVFAGFGSAGAAGAAGAICARVQDGSGSAALAGAADSIRAVVKPSSGTVTTASAAGLVHATLPDGSGEAAASGTGVSSLGAAFESIPVADVFLVAAQGVNGEMFVGGPSVLLVPLVTSDGELFLSALGGVDADDGLLLVSGRSGSVETAGCATIGTAKVFSVTGSGLVTAAGAATITTHNIFHQTFSGSGLVTTAGTVETRVGHRYDPAEGGVTASGAAQVAANGVILSMPGVKVFGSANQKFVALDAWLAAHAVRTAHPAARLRVTAKEGGRATGCEVRTFSCSAEAKASRAGVVADRGARGVVVGGQARSGQVAASSRAGAVVAVSRVVVAEVAVRSGARPADNRHVMTEAA